MSDTVVVLGSVTLSGFEIPAKIPFGGLQSLKVHKLLGGARVIDALGRDDHEIMWSGRFQGADAEARAQLIDQMRIAGQAVTLSWGEHTYSVIVSGFSVDWERFYQQPYSIICTVVQDNSTGTANSSATLDDLVGGDMDAAATLADQVTV